MPKYLITEYPGDPNRTVQVEGRTIFEAVNPLDAIDMYSIYYGYGRYSDMDPKDLDGMIGADEYGLWVVFENFTLWAIPWPPSKQPVKEYLVARFDVTGLTQAQRDYLSLEVSVQGEDGEHHPSVPVHLDWKEEEVDA